MKLLSILIAAIICFGGGLNASDSKPTSKPTLWAIIAADTDDKEIGVSVLSDQRRVEEFLERVAFYADFKLKKVILEGREFMATRMLHEIDRLKPTENDLIFFYNGGHGFHFSFQNDPWPILCYSSDNKNLGFDVIIKRLKSKKPALLLAIVDACNSFIDVVSGIERFGKEFGGAFSEELVRNNYRRLFRGRGSVVVTSSSVGEVSLGGENGGLFTNVFFDSFDEQIIDAHLTWETILIRSCDYIEMIWQLYGERMDADQQHPYFEIDFVPSE